jgi:hypothetical protein
VFNIEADSGSLAHVKLRGPVAFWHFNSTEENEENEDFSGTIGNANQTRKPGSRENEYAGFSRVQFPASVLIRAIRVNHAST